VDESGEDYFFPASKFESLTISPGLRNRLLAAGSRGFALIDTSLQVKVTG
jgi:hypothetical protein